MKSGMEFYLEVRQLKTAEDYAGALALLEVEGILYPEFGRIFAYEKVMLAALLENGTKVVQLLEACLHDDGFLPRAVFEPIDQPVFPDSIRGQADFQRLLTAHQNGWQGIIDSAKPFHKTAFPKNLEKPPLVIGFHGNSSNNEIEFPAFEPLAALGYAVVMPRSAQPWAKDRYVWGDWANTEKQISREWSLIQSMYAFSGVAAVGGYSKGGEVAIWAVLSGAIPAKGAIVLDPGGPLVENPEQFKPYLNSASQNRPAFYFVVAEQDYPHAHATQGTAAFLEKHHFRTHIEIVPGLGHHQYPEDTRDFWTKGLAFVQDHD